MVDGFGLLVEAMTIFRRYAPSVYSPLHCQHDVLTVCGVDPAAVSDEDKARLDEIGFFVASDGECFQSYRFGSA